jgi:uncharacterized protein YbjT (DUF2867 family)
MILITGATGRIGRRVVKHLLDANQDVRVLVRSLEKAKRLLPTNNIEVVVGDLGDSNAVNSAMQGVESVLLVSPVAPDQVELQGNLVRAASNQEPKPYVVKISGLMTSLDSYVDSGRWHAETEQKIKDTGLPYTFLRPLFFMQNLQFLLRSAKIEGVIRSGVKDARIAMIDAEDIAAVAALLLIEKKPLMNQAVELTAINSVTYKEVAAVLSQLLGREMRYEEQSLDQIREALINAGQPEWHINILLQFNRAFQEGHGSAANNIVRDLLGKAPTTLQQYLERELKTAEGDESNNPFPS